MTESIGTADDFIKSPSPVYWICSTGTSVNSCYSVGSLGMSLLDSIGKSFLHLVGSIGTSLDSMLSSNKSSAMIPATMMGSQPVISGVDKRGYEVPDHNLVMKVVESIGTSIDSISASLSDSVHSIG